MPLTKRAATIRTTDSPWCHHSQPDQDGRARASAKKRLKHFLMTPKGRRAHTHYDQCSFNLPHSTLCVPCSPSFVLLAFCSSSPCLLALFLLCSSSPLSSASPSVSTALGHITLPHTKYVNNSPPTILNQIVLHYVTKTSSVSILRPLSSSFVSSLFLS